MCVIVDVHMAKRVLADRDPQLITLSEAILKGRVQLMYGGQLAKEYDKVGIVAQVVVTLDRAGIAKRIDDAEISAEEKKVKQHCNSNDAHIIGLARASGARLLCSEDQALHDDFTKKGLIDRPRGKVFKDASHKHLLRNACEAC